MVSSVQCAIIKPYEAQDYAAVNALGFATSITVGSRPTNWGKTERTLEDVLSRLLHAQETSDFSALGTSPRPAAAPSAFRAGALFEGG